MTTQSTDKTTKAEQYILPFSIDINSFTSWLESQNGKNKLETLQNLSTILTALKKTTIAPDTRNFFLEKISPLVFQFSEQLQSSYLESYFPFSESDTLKINLSNTCAFNLAENYALICKDSCFKVQALFSSEQKAIILFNAIKAMAIILFYKAIVYEKPKKGFWSLSFLFYLFAKQNNLLELAPTHAPNSCFIKVFKQLLVFEMSNTQQFNTEQIHIIFNLLNNLSDQVHLLPVLADKKVNTVPYINLKSDTPPSILKQAITEETPYLFYVSSLNLIKQLFNISANNKKTPYNHKIIIIRLIKALTMNQHRKNERELADNELFVEIGFDKFTEFLLHKESLLNTKGVISYEVRDLSVDEQLAKDTHDEIYGFRSEQEASLSFTSDPDDPVKDIKNTDIWSMQEESPTPKQEKKDDTNATLIDKSNLGFCVRLRDQNIALKVGDIIHLLIPPTSVATVVRRIISTAVGEVIVGVEVLGYDAELLHVMDIDNKGAKKACALVSIDGVESIVIKADEYKNEEYMYVDRNEKILRYKIEKVLESSSSQIKHLKVSLS